MTPQFSSAVYLTIKLAALFGLAIYMAFSLVIVRQEQLMASVLEEHFEPVVRLLALIHLAASVGVFFLALIILPLG